MPLHRYKYADYAAAENFSLEKHEFLDGEIYALFGGTAEHAGLSAMMTATLLDAIDQRPYAVHGCLLRVHVEGVGLTTYPDCSVMRLPVQLYEPGPADTALNPIILAEVTSDATEDYDLGFKRQCYRTIPTLREYIIVSHRVRRITMDVREGESWKTHVANRGESLVLNSLQVEIAVDDIYRKSTIP